MNHDRPANRDPDEQALAFLARMQGETTAADRAAFDAWLAASPANRAAWERARSLWEASGEAGQRVADEEASKLAHYRKRIAAKRRTKLQRRNGAVAALLLAIGLGGFWLERPDFLQDLTADYTSGRGERRLVTLADASTVLLDADTAIDVDYSATMRRVRLLRGNAFFTVARTGLPFIVDAAMSEVRVLGTEFDVRLQPAGAVVTLARGTVEVSGAAKAATLAPGEQVRIDDGSLGPVEKTDLEAALAWREGRLVFYDRPLADVIAEIARYRSGRIIVASDRLASSIVSGSVPLDDPDAALRSLQSSVGFSMRSIAGRLVVIY